MISVKRFFVTFRDEVIAIWQAYQVKEKIRNKKQINERQEWFTSPMTWAETGMNT
jgi:hypothetical protein